MGVLLIIVEQWIDRTSCGGPPPGEVRVYTNCHDGRFAAAAQHLRHKPTPTKIFILGIGLGTGLGRRPSSFVIVTVICTPFPKVAAWMFSRVSRTISRALCVTRH